MARPKSVHNIQDAELSTINMLIYGHPGEGKTPLWGTGGARLVLIDSDNGYESALASGSVATRAPATSYAEMDEIYEWCKNDVCKKERPDDNEFNWFVWDSLTLFQDRAMMDDLMEDAHAANENQDRWVPSKRQYMIDHSRIGSLVRQFVALPINFGISCHVMVDTDLSDGSTLWMPAVQGWSGGVSMASKISGYMNVIALLGTAQVGTKDKPRSVKRLLTQREGKFYARDRFGALGHHVDSPSIPDITATIEAKRAKGATAPSAATTPTRRRRRRTA